MCCSRGLLASARVNQDSHDSSLTPCASGREGLSNNKAIDWLRTNFQGEGNDTWATIDCSMSRDIVRHV